MSPFDLRPRSATELVDAAFQVFRRDPTQFLVATAMVYVPWLVIRLVFDLRVNGGELPDLNHALAAAFIGIVVYAIVGGAVTLLASEVYLGRPLDLAGAFRRVGAHALPLIVSSFVTFGLVVAAAIFLLLPALYPLARYFAVRQVVMLEDAGVGTALARSSALSVDMKRHILSTILLVGLIGLAVSAGSGALIDLIPSSVLKEVLSTAVSIVIYPFFAITETLLYYDVRIRKEGFDIEYLARADAPPAEAPNAAD